MSAPKPTKSSLDLLYALDMSEDGQCVIDGVIHPNGSYDDQSEYVCGEKVASLVAAGLMRRRHISGWRLQDFYVPTDAGHELAQSMRPRMGVPLPSDLAKTRATKDTPIEDLQP